MTRNENLYGTKVVQIPPPEFVIFYNGEKDMPEETPLRLSDMYRLKVEEPKLQLEAVERAIDECIAEDVLKDFLTKHRAEAKAMSIFEYDQEKHIRQEREEAWEDTEEISASSGLPTEQIRGLLGQKK